ncbi:MAG: dipeptidyl aminopeptidase [Rhodovulum sulfidophilum]|uniref:Dipeptidyl aminopeptidase n=1 Tax=Rhodovulum sulfidophilum TaxID=35806 RepID=A0A2W5N578_RHOSU|nr:MAG: dipeptidyl aminopeptidase [Rhodovulum sulfidophilum]
MTDPRRFFTDPGFDFETRIALGAVRYGLAEAGEVLATAATITDGDLDGWFDAWTATATRLRAAAEAAEAAGQPVSAREAWLRAAKYSGMANFFVLGTRDPSRVGPAWEWHRACAERGFALFPNARRVAIPYEGVTLDGWWFSGGEGPRPLAIINNGSDGTIVDMLGQGVVAATDRGWHALVFDGPGQGAALYRSGLPFRPDWEAVIAPVVDFALARPDTDAARVALIGISQGGYWVPRAAAFETRLAAAVADPGVTRVWSSWFDGFPPEVLDLFRAGDKAAFDAAMTEGMKEAPARLRFELAKRAEPYRISSVFDLLTELRRYDLTGIADKIRCPTLVLAPENEAFWPGQSQELFDALTCPKALLPFTAAEGADGHCEPMAPALRSARVFDWLEALPRTAPGA